MHIQLPQKELESAATIVSSLVARGAGPLPVASHLLIDATEQGVQFRGTDMESLVTVNLNATVKSPGRTTVPADKFHELVRLLPPAGEVTLEETAHKVHIQCESNDYRLMTLPAEDFPQWPAATPSSKFQISQKMLKTLIDATSYALPVKDHRRVLLGIYFEMFDHTLRLTATDGKKLARMSAPIPEVEGSDSGTIIVPRKLLDNLARYLGTEGPVEIELGNSEGNVASQITFRFANVIYRCNGISGKYPDCDSVIPKEFPTRIDFNREALIQASRRAGVVAGDEKSKSIVLKFGDNQCLFNSMAHDLGTFNGRVSLDYSGPPFELGFNFEFLNESLSRFSTSELRLLIKSPASPIVIKTREEEDNRLALLMPIKLTDIRPAPIQEEVDEEDDGYPEEN